MALPAIHILLEQSLFEPRSAVHRLSATGGCRSAGRCYAAGCWRGAAVRSSACALRTCSSIRDASGQGRRLAVTVCTHIDDWLKLGTPSNFHQYELPTRARVFRASGVRPDDRRYGIAWPTSYACRNPVIPPCAIGDSRSPCRPPRHGAPSPRARATATPLRLAPRTSVGWRSRHTADRGVGLAASFPALRFRSVSSP
jgi:hypothetical protein